MKKLILGFGLTMMSLNVFAARESIFVEGEDLLHKGRKCMIEIMKESFESHGVVELNIQVANEVGQDRTIIASEKYLRLKKGDKITKSDLKIENGMVTSQLVLNKKGQLEGFSTELDSRVMLYPDELNVSEIDLRMECVLNKAINLR